MLAQDTCYAKLTGFQKNPKYMGVQWGELSVEILSLHGSRGGFIVQCQDSVPISQFRKEESFMSFVCSVALPVQRRLVVNHVMHSSPLLVLTQSC